MASRKILLHEHVYTLPEPPTKKSEVLFSKEKTANQYWRRQKDIPNIYFDYIPGFTKINQQVTLYDQDDNLMSLSEDDTKILIRFVEREIHRRTHGVWFMNNGVLEYATGDHYFLLQWGEMHGYINNEFEGCQYSINGSAHPDFGSPFGMYREFQRDIAYFIDLTRKDPLCAGGFIGKAKKTGVTQFMSLMFLNESTLIRQKRFAMMSKSHNDCKDTNMMLYQHALDRLPLIQRPKIKNKNLSKVVFDKPKKGITGSVKQMIEAGSKDGFQTSVEALPTKEDGFDGPKVYRSWLDEFMKYESPYPQDVFDKSSEATKMQHDIVGKQYLTCYPPEDDKKGYIQSRKIWHECALSTRNEIGQTKSGLYQYFVSALEATEGTFDWYGKPNQKEAYRRNHARRDQVANDRRALQKLKRQYPETIKEMWEAGGAGSTWDNIRIGNQLTDIEEEERKGAVYFQDGYLEWTNGSMSAVRFVAVTPEDVVNGTIAPFRMYESMDPDEVNWCVKGDDKKDEYDRLMVNPDNLIVISVDPTDYKESSEVAQGSKNSITFGMAPNPTRNTKKGRIASNIVFGEYLYRPDDPDDMYDDLLKLIVYTGGYVVVEANKGWVLTRLKKDNLQNFLMVWDNKKKCLRPYRQGDEKTAVNTTSTMIDDYCRAISRYIRKLTQQEEGDLDMLTLIKSTRLLEQLMNFDPLNTRIYDMVVSLGYWRMGIEALSFVKEYGDTGNGIFTEDAVNALLNALDDL